MALLLAAMLALTLVDLLVLMMAEMKVVKKEKMLVGH
jgi:hypothetical protein